MAFEPDIDLATSADADAVIALWKLCGLTRPWNDPQEDFARALDSENSCVLLVYDDEILVGSIMVGDDGHRGWVYYLASHPNRRGEGIGRQLMYSAERWLKLRGCPKIQLMVRDDNVEGRGFYTRIGYEVQDVVTIGRRLDD